MRLVVRDIIGEFAITLEDGRRVYDLIAPALRAGQAVELDFAGVTVFAAGFFNSAIGQLLEEFQENDLRRLLIPVNLTPAGESVLRQVMENAKRYYSAPKDYREAQRRVLEALTKET
jgi:hypothetical protein